MKRRLVFNRPSLTQARSLFATACLALVVAPVAWTQATGPEVTSPARSLGAIGAEVRSLFEKSRQAVVRVTADDFHGSLSGTGFFVNPNGTVFTTFSVAGESWNVIVEFAGKKYPAVRLLADERSGLAVLKISTSGTPFLPLGTPADLTVAVPIFSIGYPLDLPVTPNVGFIAGFDQKYLGRYLSTTHLRANLPAHRGEQGAPLLNMKGEVIGILVARMDDVGNTCFALPIHAARKVFQDYERFGVARPGWVGVNIVASGGSFDTDGSEAVVRGLIEDAPATAAGVEEGDVILEFGGTPIRKPADMIDAAFFLTGGDKVALKLKRGDEIVTLEMQAIDNPTLPASNQLNELIELDRFKYAEGEPAPLDGRRQKLEAKP